MATLSSPTLQSLLTATRIILRQRDPNNSTWSDEELTLYINDAIQLYFQEYVMANEGYFTVQTGTTIPDLDIISDQETVALPDDCFEVKNVWKQVSDGWVNLQYRNTMTESYINQGGTDSDTYFPYYYFQGNNLVLRPTPNFSQVGGIRLEYTQFPETLIYGGDVMTSQISPVFKQMVIMFSVYKAKLSESMTNGVDLYSIAESNLAALVILFKDVIAKRSKSPTFIEPFNPEF